jgi:hypothetical protein
LVGWSFEKGGASLEGIPVSNLGWLRLREPLLLSSTVLPSSMTTLAPEALDDLEAAVAPDGSLEVSGDVISVCEMELSSL